MIIDLLCVNMSAKYSFTQQVYDLNYLQSFLITNSLPVSYINSDGGSALDIFMSSSLTTGQFTTLTSLLTNFTNPAIMQPLLEQLSVGTVIATMGSFTVASISGNMNVMGGLNVGSSTTLSNLTVTGSSTFGSNVNVTGDTTMNGALLVQNPASFTSNLQVSGAPTFLGTALFGSNLSVSGDTTLNGALAVQSPVSFGSNLRVTGVTNMSVTNITGPLTVNASVTMTGNTSFSSNVSILGTLSGSSGSFTGCIQTGTVKAITGSFTGPLITAGNCVVYKTLTSFNSFFSQISSANPIIFQGPGGIASAVNIDVSTYGYAGSNLLPAIRWQYFDLGSYLNTVNLLQFDGNTLSSRLFVNSSGQIGIGNSSPAYQLDVTGSTRVSGNMLATGTSSAKLLTLGTITTPGLPAAGMQSLYIDANDGKTKVLSFTKGTVDILNPLTTKGDLCVHNGSSHDRLPIGTAVNMSILTDPTTTLGLKYVPAFGSEYQIIQDDAAVGSSNNNFSNRLILVSTLSGGVYSTRYTYHYTSSASGAYSGSQVLVDSTIVDDEIQFMNNAGMTLSSSGFVSSTLTSGTHSTIVRWRNATASGFLSGPPTISMSKVRIEMFRVA